MATSDNVFYVRLDTFSKNGRQKQRRTFYFVWFQETVPKVRYIQKFRSNIILIIKVKEIYKNQAV